MASFYVPLLVMVVVYVKILRVVADKKKTMSWKTDTAPTHRSSSLSNHSHVGRSSGTPLLNTTNHLLPLTSNGHTHILTNNNNKQGHLFPTTTLHRLKKGETFSYYITQVVIREKGG
jgi:hypothetical protein